MLGSETLFAEVDELEDANGRKTELTSPLLIDIAKNAPRYVYPLVYQRDFAYFAYEQVV